ncbi:conserved hypothetical protein [Culex quinquefasciatus]|uniref:Uncharacterized protein n=1 Tax=Culex quinquefasciatus TaxID=7176 RepID=B0XLR4_CULQU|nr:uncharacterized protein LOC6054715 [Culex quinquefasciatus]XP_039445848.1 uncharacterized protein LOC120425400 [Culex pipiens pallens]EDS34707.1 conserved hypothetical protein [Culex quinquefasciatus]|eukprot:XP_001891378.1 conserved hypothetical protein [Culex pipiens quinquefasciatus]
MSHVESVHLVQIIVLLLAVGHIGADLYQMNVEFDRYEIEYSVIGRFDRVRIRKFNRTTPVINGSYDLAVDLDNNYEIGIVCSRSALGNNQYHLIPFKLSPMPVCNFIKKYAFDYQDIWQNKSNFPRVPAEGICPYPKGTYWVKDLALDSNLFPPVIPEGYYRCYLDVYRISPRELLHHQAYYSRITKELLKY